MHIRINTALLPLVFLLLTACPGDGENGGGQLKPFGEGTTRVSVADDESEANGQSYRFSVSADGRYVAFGSSADNLLGSGNDTNLAGDVFIRDTVAGTTTRVSVADDESEANRDSFDPSISADGRYVAFISFADNLVGVGNDNNNLNADVFVRDTVAGTTTRVSVADDESEANSGSFYPSISTDGRYVAFFSFADNLVGVGNDTNLELDVFIRDTVAGTTTRVSVADDESEANGTSGESSISADGRYVAFHSNADNLLGVGNDTNMRTDVFIRDTVAGTTTRVSVADDESEAIFGGYAPSISADGRYVAFISGADNLLGSGNDNNIEPDVFIRDTVAGTTTRVSVADDESEANGGVPFSPSISADGRYVAFVSSADNLLGAGNDTNLALDVFIRDTVAGTTTRVSVADDESEANGGVIYMPSISADGRYVAFVSSADNLLGMGNDTNETYDVFIRSLSIMP